MQKQDVLLARQPIYRSDKELYGYELLFRDNEQNSAKIFCDLSATSNVLLNLFTESDLEEVTGGTPAFVNFTADLLAQPLIFDPHAVVIELLEHVEVTPSLIKHIIKLKKLGYTIALDDVVNAPKYKPLLDHIDIVKVEITDLNPSQLQETVAYLAPYDITLLAEKVETQEDFSICKELGFDLFQGYFLSKPEIVKGKKLNTSQIGVLNLIAELQNPETEVNRLSEIIGQDPVLSFKLLKLINSAAYRRSKEIDSIKSAVALLGISRIRSWASLLALSKLDNKPDSLQYVAIVRAMTCEQIAERLDPTSRGEFYTAGLFSCLDAFFDQPLDEVIEQLPLKESIREAIIKGDGAQGLALSSTVLFEQGRLDEIDWTSLENEGLSVQDLNDIYYQSSALALETEGF